MARSFAISDLQPDDHLDLAAKRDWVLSQSNHPEKVTTVEARLHLLDTIIQSNAIAPEETVELQALGVILGDAIAEELDLDWRIYEDETGRDPALIVPGTEIQVFPLTMISKRVEDGEEVDIVELFAMICAHVKILAREQKQSTA